MTPLLVVPLLRQQTQPEYRRLLTRQASNRVDGTAGSPSLIVKSPM